MSDAVIPGEPVTRRILAIEAEARAAALDEVEQERESAYSHGYGDGLREGMARGFNATDLARALSGLDRTGTNPQFAERLYAAYTARLAAINALKEKP